MGAIKNMYLDAAANLTEELHREPTDEEIEERVQAMLAKMRRLRNEKPE